jgi:hypothetical protein
MRGEPLKVLRTVLLMLSLLTGAGLACRAGGSPASDIATPTAVSTKSPAPTSTATFTRLPSPTAIPTALPLPEGAGPIDVLIGYRFLTDPQDLPAGELILYRDPLILNRINYLTWDGETGPLLEIDGPTRENGLPRFWTVDARESARYVWIGWDPDIPYSDAYYYVVFDVLAGKAWGYHPICPEGEHVSPVDVVGPRYWAYRCYDDQSPIWLVPLEKPSEGFGLPLPRPFGLYSSIHWVNEDELLVVRTDESTYCIGRVSDWDPRCGTAPFGLISVSADGQWVEVHEPGDSLKPERIGVIPTSCLWEAGGSKCEPVWAQANGVVANWTKQSELRERLIYMNGAFAPDGTRLLLLSAEVPSGLEHGSLPAEVWVLDSGKGELRKIASIPVARLGWPTFRKDSIDSGNTAPLWSPDGQWVLLEDGFPLKDPRPLYKLSVETGGLQQLLPLAGDVLGTLDVP